MESGVGCLLGAQVEESGITLQATYTVGIVCHSALHKLAGASMEQRERESWCRDRCHRSSELCPEPGSWLPNCFQTFLLYTWAKTSASPQCATFNGDYQWTARLSNLA